jgi:acyl-CoA hydrolase
MNARPARESRAQLVKWMGVLDANTAGFVHGGTMMKLCDEAAALAAVKHSRCRVVTAGMDRMTFLVPVRLGELVTFSAAVNAVWRTSMEVGVRVEAENPRSDERRHTNTAYLTMVALDADGRPAPVAGLLLEDDVERRREREAQVRRANRLAEREQILAHRDARG